MHKFKAGIEIIGVNPFVFVPEKILKTLFEQAGRDKGKIPVCGSVNNKPYKQTLLRYSGHWRLYINTFMLKNSPKRVGEMIELTIQHDPADRTLKPHPAFEKALQESKQAKAIFESLSPSRRHEIIRYIAHLKTEESRKRNILRAIDFLSGKARFVGRDKP
jgi:hypothetical protein